MRQNNTQTELRKSTFKTNRHLIQHVSALITAIFGV